MLPSASSSPSIRHARDDPSAGLVHVRAEGSTVVLVVPHRLDAAAGRILLDLAASALVGDTTEVEIDLEAVESFTEEGARALAACRTLGSRLPKGLRYRARSPGGRRLLMAMADADRGC